MELVGSTVTNITFDDQIIAGKLKLMLLKYCFLKYVVTPLVTVERNCASAPMYLNEKRVEISTEITGTPGRLGD